MAVTLRNAGAVALVASAATITPVIPLAIGGTGPAADDIMVAILTKGNNAARTVVVVWQGCVASGDPFDVVATSTDSPADTTVDLPAITTTVADTCVVTVGSWDIAMST